MKIINLLAISAILVCGAETMKAQNLTAAQMNIYFGNPKKVTVQNSQGVVVTEFDCLGRIESVTQGNMHMKYEWDDGGSEVILTMFQGPNIKDSGIIKISELSKKHYSYNAGGTMDIQVDFLDNGAMSKSVISNPQMAVTTKYYYKNADDVFPYSIEQSMGDQSIKASLSIDSLDAVGNPIEYTQEMMGQKEVTRQTIEYY